MKQFCHFQPSGMADALPYLLTRPDGSEQESLPMIVFLHGAGERGDDETLLRVHGIPRYFAENQTHMDQRVITLSPQCPAGNWWSNMTDAVMELIVKIAEEQNADPDHISITGISMGGYGIWALLPKHPDFFSAACPICGDGKPIEVLIKTPVRAFHGEADDCVPFEGSVRMVESVNAHGGNATLTAYPDCRHDSWTRTYEQTDIIPWLISAQRVD